MFSKLFNNKKKFKSKHSTRSKKLSLFVLTMVVLFLVYVIYLAFAAVKDYSWSKEYISSKQNDWVVVTEANPKTNPFYIYSLFNPPESLISLINKKSKVVQNNIIYVEDLWVKREIGIGSTTEEQYSYLINCDTFESGWNSDLSNIDGNNINLNSIKWLANESSNSPEHYREICQMVIMHELTTPIIQSQKQIVNKYLDAVPSKEERVDILLDLMAPLGPLDPISKPEETKNAKALVNFLFGYYSTEFDIGSVVTPGFLATAPLRVAESFDSKGYLHDNTQALNDLAQKMNSNPDIDILANWNSSIYRINNKFTDSERNFNWEVSQKDTPFYSYKINLSSKLEDQSQYSDMLQKMHALKIQTIYKCDNKIIFILIGTSNNAFGYIYNASSGNELNCGLLSDRFSIKEEQMLDSKWRYWVAR